MKLLNSLLNNCFQYKLKVSMHKEFLLAHFSYFCYTIEYVDIDDYLPVGDM